MHTPRTCYATAYRCPRPGMGVPRA